MQITDENCVTETLPDTGLSKLQAGASAQQCMASDLSPSSVLLRPLLPPGLQVARAAPYECVASDTLEVLCTY